MYFKRISKRSDTRWLKIAPVFFLFGELCSNTLGKTACSFFSDLANFGRALNITYNKINDLRFAVTSK